MKNSRRKFTASFKARVVMEALKERETLSEVASRYDVHPNQITTWKREFLEGASKAFEKEEKGELREMRKERDRLLKIIGEQKVDLDFLKKALS